MMGGLAVAAIASTALSLFHELDATVTIRAWNLGTAVLITGLGSISAPLRMHAVGRRPARPWEFCRGSALCHVWLLTIVLLLSRIL
jgi:hypothetical protein